MDNQQIIISRFWQQQEKYVYYIIAVAVTAIGFVLVNTKGEPLSYLHITLGLSILSWGISIFCGLRFLQYVISTLYANYDYLEVLKGRHQEVGTNPHMIEAASSGIRDAMKSNSEATNRIGKLQNTFFYLGFLFYIIWHVSEMYFITV